jgi:AraC-like DNA-binding protein
MPTPYPQVWSWAWLYPRYVIEERFLDDIAAEAGCSVRTVSAAVAHFHLQRDNRGRRPRPQPVLESGAQLAALYTQAGSVPKLARHLHCSEGAIRRALDVHGIARMTPPVKYTDQAWFARRVAQGMSMRAIAAEAGCAPRSVKRALARHGLTQPAPTASS